MNRQVPTTEQPVRRAIAVDFDGVIHAYTSAWRLDEEGHGCIDDPPVPGAIEWLSEMVERFDVWIFTCRLLHPKRSQCERRLRVWLVENGCRRSVIERLHFTHEKPHADVYLDDRAIRFEGAFPTLEEIKAASVPWNKRSLS